MPRAPFFDDPVLGPVTRDRLTRDFWVYQRRAGHRFSSDDAVTALIAFEAVPSARRIADLGTGLGSVLLQLAWKLPHAELVGVEAQAVSYELLQRNVEQNQLGARVRTLHGDLRSAEIIAELGGGFDLVTGTPPYFPVGSALDAEDEQRAYARIEYRGGVEAYLDAAASLLASDGVFVFVGDADAETRVASGAESAGLALTARTVVLPRAGRPPLFSVWTLARHAAACRNETWSLRDPDGHPTAEARRLREFAGFSGEAAENSNNAIDNSAITDT